jgi:hypothetical protein
LQLFRVEVGVWPSSPLARRVCRNRRLSLVWSLVRQVGLFYLGRSKFVVYFRLYTHLHGSALQSDGSKTRSHLQFWWIESISDFKACCHIAKSGADFTSE